MGYSLSFLLLLGATLLPAAAATAAALVEQLQMPVWIEHEGTRTALQPGWSVTEDDTLETGRDGRLHILFPDGSLFMLGAETWVTVEELFTPQAPSGTFRVSLEVTRGTFRWVSGQGVRPWQRDITLRSRTTRVDLRQADVCGQSNDQAVIVCLVAGALTIEQPGIGRLDMRQPQTVFMAPVTGEPAPIAPADPEMFEAWLSASALVAGRGIAVAGGGWVVQLAAFADVRAADALAQRLRQAGYAVKAKTTQLHNRTIHRLRVIADQFRITHPWVTCPAATSCR
jgi:hypothetical protein